MANTTTKIERERITALAAAMLPANEPDLTTMQSIARRLADEQQITYDRAIHAVANALMRRRGVLRNPEPDARYGIRLDIASLEHIAAIERATGLSGASAVIRQALRRWAEGL